MSAPRSDGSAHPAGTMSARPAAGWVTWLARVFRPVRPRSGDAPRLAEPGAVGRVLAVKVHDQLGDFLLATPALRALRRRYPAARLALVTRTFLAPLAARDPDLDDVWVLPRVRRLSDLGELA